jgi:hypothetical protein
MRRLSRELTSALRLSFEAWPDVAARLVGINSPAGFEEDSPKGAVVHVIDVSGLHFHPRSLTRLRQRDCELKMRDGFGHQLSS